MSKYTTLHLFTLWDGQEFYNATRVLHSFFGNKTRRLLVEWENRKELSFDMATESTGITRDWAFDGRIVIYELTAATVATITEWSELAVNTLRDWPKDRPYLALHDISHPGVGLLYMIAAQDSVLNIGVSPGAEKLIQEITNANPDWKLALALVVSNSLSGSVAKLKMFQKISPEDRVQSKIFFSRSSALGWLKDCYGS
ncbi:MAG: hypothetical protein KJ065_12790 [Anaerolineae bacterium]|nr:hypothetical protein [Anaerolineae bacterium]